MFLQYGSKDAPIPERIARKDYERFGEPKKMAFYESGHELNAAARRDRVAWLTERLKPRAVDIAELDRIPDLK